MKSFKEFLLEKEEKAITIEQLADICRKLVKEISDKVDIPLGLMQQSIVIMEKPYPHIHCQVEILKAGLKEDDKFLSDEVCGMFASMAKDYDLTVSNVKKGDEHGEPGDILATTKIESN